jgi:hypothetical protein
MEKQTLTRGRGSNLWEKGKKEEEGIRPKHFVDPNKMAHPGPQAHKPTNPQNLR